MRNTFFLLLLLLPTVLKGQCNGHLQLCNRPYNQVAYLTTHNAFNAEEDGFALPNQNFGLTQQLEFGVRALMLDVYDEGGIATVYHGFSFLGTASLASNLEEIKGFMDANPNEVVTIIFESYVSSEMMSDVFAQVGLQAYLHTQTIGEPWPTLQQMIDSNRRLVVFSDENDALPAQEWYHYVWDHAVETNFTNNSPADFDCDFNRGDSLNDLFIINHFVTATGIGTGQPDQAAIVNELSFFYDRVLGCQQEKLKFPNFPTIDFYELGQTMAVIDSLNGIQTSLGVEDNGRTGSVSVFPNPSAGIFSMDIQGQIGDSHYTLFNTLGTPIRSGSFINGISIDLIDEPQGIYHLYIEHDHGSEVSKLIKF